MNALKSNQEASARELFSQQSALREATSALEKQKEKTITYRNQSEALEAELAALRVQSESKVKSFEEQVLSLQSALASAAASAAESASLALEQHKQEMSELKGNLVDLQGKLEAALKRNEELEQALLNSSKALSSSKGSKKGSSAAARTPDAAPEAIVPNIVLPPSSPLSSLSPEDQPPSPPISFYSPFGAGAGAVSSRGMSSLVMSARSAAELDQVAPMLNASPLPATAPVKVRKTRTSRKALVAKSVAEGSEEGAAPAEEVKEEVRVEGSTPEAEAKPAAKGKTVAARSAAKRDSIVKRVVARAKKVVGGEGETSSL